MSPGSPQEVKGSHINRGVDVNVARYVQCQAAIDGADGRIDIHVAQRKQAQGSCGIPADWRLDIQISRLAALSVSLQKNIGAGQIGDESVCTNAAGGLSLATRRYGEIGGVDKPLAGLSLGRLSSDSSRRCYLYLCTTRFDETAVATVDGAGIQSTGNLGTPTVLQIGQ
ncbi:hypothetical protein ALQ02_200057 [Pseudomonas savastanoi pv. phaseolicola]|nr:hypothetical protein ALQ02_200057 [Pseudomonas savastanoi pv. phaseolicola]